jgi:hypothetical protein
MKSQLLKASINAVVREFGFNSKDWSYYLVCSDVVLVISLRKSTHGNYCYLDCGINLIALSGDAMPSVSDCGIQFSLNVLAGEDVSVIVKALDMDSAQEDDVANLVLLMRRQCLPQLLDMSSLAVLRNMYKQGRLKGALVLKQAREVLESNGCRCRPDTIFVNHDHD